ncbi:MAG: AAA family ATPase [Lamprobacter sp.]|uniref:AAA family ATPase n=1 Tax=Lamprobacter sp. TaxID=3100796 RepID=UPI002B263774|nr:AAA family ATPase [Lamprobacter sp.]MEA3639053.1 AAA family ATPase [Lamprobacter sp.]
MRIARIDLTRYGHFTDKQLELPRSEADFHLLVGANETGKSTLRSAILDLLFGIEMRSPYNFLHAYTDMRLGALVQQGEEALDFRRTKRRSRTLRDADDAALPDTSLTPFLGGVERGFFEQMFGLDHERLVAGGQNILSARSDVGQILFQSAAGIAQFGDVRDAFESEMNSLWAKRYSGEREYYIAADELSRAKDALKEATMQTREWVSARNDKERLEQEAADLRKRHEQLARQSARLQRARRTAPIINALRERETDLQALGPVRILPEDAANRLAEAERHKAIAASARKLHEKQATEKEDARESLRPDKAVMVLGQDIESLAAQREQVRNHPGDVDKRREEARAHWKTVETLLQRLGWPSMDEDNLLARLPSQISRENAEALIRDHHTLEQGVKSARHHRDDKAEEIKRIDLELARLPSTVLPAKLVTALAHAQGLGDVATQEQRLADAVKRAERALDKTLPALSPWQSEPRRLRNLSLPGSNEIEALREDRNRLKGDLQRLERDIHGYQSRLSGLDLEIDQYEATHKPVTLSELQGARDRRDRLWREIRDGTESLLVTADRYEGFVAEADSLADRRHDKAEEAATLQSKQDERARIQQQLERDLSDVAGIRKQQQATQKEWAARTEALGLKEMTLEQMGPWCIARDKFLSADEHLMESREQVESLRHQVDAARKALAGALTPAPDPGESLASLVHLASTQVDRAKQAQTRRKALEDQRTAAEAALESLDQRLTQAMEKLERWRDGWASCLDRLNLPTETDTEAAERALSILADMNDHLSKRRELRDARIRPMERDLQRFSEAAKGLARELDPALRERAPEDIARILSERLAQARHDAKDHERLTKEIETARRDAERETRKQMEAQAAIEPLLAEANAADNDALRKAITRSDQARTLENDIAKLKRSLSEGSDGLTRETLETELAELEIGAIPGELEVLRQDQEKLVEKQRENAAALTTAEAEFRLIAGQDDAARAEAQRQEALARMGNAVERYLRTYTAARLLRWAIERYREERQGPMLARAGEIFAGFTLGSFDRLVVDYEGDTPVLYGQRRSRERVAIEGMSDGTRDQLYLALRLAALELHLEQSQPMPFIADDLFINWDENRASAGFAALEDLSRRTQVFFLTHHDHLVPLAQRVIDGRLNVINLA